MTEPSEIEAAAELCRKYPPGTGIDTKSEFDRFAEARELIVAEYLKEHSPDDNRVVHLAGNKQPIRDAKVALFNEFAYFLGPDQWEKSEKVLWKIIQDLLDEKEAEIERLREQPNG